MRVETLVMVVAAELQWSKVLEMAEEVELWLSEKKARGKGELHERMGTH